MAPTFDRQMSVQMEWLESKELITARGFAEFRNKTLSLYQARVRSMTVSVDRHCQFSHPNFQQTGRWYGSCDDGKASGRGYGLVSNERGGQVEFLGYAENGMASGSGGMIIKQRGTLGATYYEGSFGAGVPNGIVRVEKPGSAPALRQFRAGNDVGRGNAGELQKLSFRSSSASAVSLNP